MILGKTLHNIPWEERNEKTKDVVWRYSNNPIIKRGQIPSANSIFNSVVIDKDGAFVGIFRSDNRAMMDQNRGWTNSN